MTARQKSAPEPVAATTPPAHLLQAELPTLWVLAGTINWKPSQVHFKRILIPSDGSQVTSDAGRVELDLATALDAEAGLIHVIGPANSDAAWYAVPSAELLQPGPDETADILASLRRMRPIPEGSPRFLPVGEPVAAIVEAA